MSNVIPFRRASSQMNRERIHRPEELRLDSLRRFLEDERVNQGAKNGDELTAFIRALQEQTRALEREAVARFLEASDVDADAIEIQGKVHRRVLRSKQVYMTEVGEVGVERWLFKDRSNPEAKAVAALEERLGVVAGFWTPGAAKTAAWVVAQMTPQKAEELFERVAQMQPSKSSLDRLPKALSERWEQDRERHEQALREAIVVPEGTKSIAVMLDGVMAPIDGGKSPTAVRDEAASAGKLSKGPAGYREMGCATLAFCDNSGDLISAIRFGRAPEPKKATLKAILSLDLAQVLAKHPELPVVKIADAGSDNFDYLAKLPAGPEILDFYHATEHLSAALAAVYGDGTSRTRRKHEELRDRLLESPKGVDSVINALAYLKRTNPTTPRLDQELAYFRKNRHRMRYAEWKAAGYMIGSGVVEAACKTLVAQRLKLSGMRWSADGAQAILTLRGWDQSDRFDEAWALLAATYQCEIHVLAQIVDISPSPSHRTARRRKRTTSE